MKQKSKLKRLLSAFALVATMVAATVGGAIGLNHKLEASAEDDTALETTYLTGFRSSNSATTHIYWRIDGTSLGYAANQVLASPSVEYTSGGETTTKTINMQYSTASTQGVTGTLGGTSDRRKGDVVSTHPTIYINISNPVNGDTYTIPSGTVLGEKYVLDQDYTFTYNGSNWLFSEETRIPVSLDGARSGGASAIYAFGAKNLENYYVTDIRLHASMAIEYYPAEGEQTSITAEVKPETPSDTANVTSKRALLFNLSKSVSVGDSIVIKKGTSFDNYAFDRDYKFTYVADSKWAMEATANEDDETMELSLRGGAADTLNLYSNAALSYAVDERIALNTAVYVNGKSVHTNYFSGLAKVGENYSFSVRFTSKLEADSIVKFPKDMIIAGYKLADNYLFKWSGSAWSLVACDGSDGATHIFNDNFTCHDRTCVCGYVETATTAHTFADGTYVCQDRTCTTCGDAVAATAHTFADNTYACQDRTCTVCNANVAGDPEQHVKTGEGCASSCKNCGTVFATHSYPETPENGWTINDSAVTVSKQPTCTEKGVGTVKCENCDSTKEVEVNALGHDVQEGEKYCSRNCGYRIAYTADDMQEVLALESLVKYTYSDAHVESDKSVFGTLDATNESGFLINTTKNADKEYSYDSDKASAHDMIVSFSIIPTEWASASRQSYVWLNAHENGSWGIGFMFNMNESAQNLRIVYKSDDSGYTMFGDPKTLSGFALNEKQEFTFGVVQNSDGSYFAFAYYNGALLTSGTLTNEIIASKGVAANHNGLGGAISFRFNGSAAAPAIKGTICDLEHSVEGTQYACKDYACKVCGAILASTAEHSWGNSVKTGDGSCTVKEVYTRTCSVCAETTTYEGDYVHTWDTENPSVVTEAACNGVDRVVKYNCANCDAVSEECTIEGSGIEGAHNFVYEDIVPATCVAGGTEQGTCSKCGESKIDETPINTKAHSYSAEIAEKAATCTENGVKAHYTCTLCQKLFVKDGDTYKAVIEADLVITAAHSYVKVDAVEPTAEADGMKEHYKCSVCEKLFEMKAENEYVETTAEALKVVYVAPDSSTEENSSTEDNNSTEDKTSTESEKKGGCGSSLSMMGLISMLTLCGATVAVARKRKN